MALLVILYKTEATRSLASAKHLLGASTPSPSPSDGSWESSVFQWLENTTYIVIVVAFTVMQLQVGFQRTALAFNSAEPGSLPNNTTEIINPQRNRKLGGKKPANKMNIEHRF